MSKIVQFQLETNPGLSRDLVVLLRDGTLWERYLYRDAGPKGYREEWRQIKGPLEEWQCTALSGDTGA